MKNNKKINIACAVICGVSAWGCFVAGGMMTVACKKFIKDSMKKGEN